MHPLKEPIENQAHLPDGYASLLTKAPAWKDVVLVPRWNSVRLLVPAMEYNGMSMFYCHIVEHEGSEMMRPFRVGPVRPGQPRVRFWQPSIPRPTETPS